MAKFTTRTCEVVGCNNPGSQQVVVYTNVTVFGHECRTHVPVCDYHIENMPKADDALRVPWPVGVNEE